jgi:sirohydrochlorin ferrochelatase
MRPIILLGHGSPDPRSAAGLRALARAVTRRLPTTLVEVAFLDHDEPSLTAVAAELSAGGHASAAVVPAFLTSAFHVRSDVPRVVAAAERSSGMSLPITAPIGPDARLLDEMSTHLPASAPLVLAVAGTRDERALADLDALAAQWSTTRGTVVVVAHAAMSDPDVSTAIASVRAAGEPAVAAYVLFPGVLPDRIAAAAGDLPCSPPVGASDAAVDIVIDRALDISLAS